MTWEWSHTQEAYDFVQGRLRELPPEELCTIFAEIVVAAALRASGRDSDFGQWPAWAHALHDTMKAEAASEGADTLVGVIWAFASAQRRCTNGGWEAHLCPFGCGLHMVPFGPAVEEDAEAGA